MTASLVLERQGHLQNGWREKMMGGERRKQFFESPDRLRLFLEPGPVVVTSSDSIYKALVKGGRLTADYQQRQAALKLMQDNLKKADPKGDAIAFNHATAQANQAFIQAYPASWVSFEVLQQLPTYTPYSETAPLYAALSPGPAQQPGRAAVRPAAGQATGDCRRSPGPRLRAADPGRPAGFAGRLPGQIRAT